jgi:signal transduction histidine kinase
MLDRVTDFRALTKISQGALLRSDTDIAALVRSVLEEYAAEIGARGVRVESDDLPRLGVYANLLRLLYGNLVRNALEHASPGAFVLAFTAERGAREWVLGVRNTGSEVCVRDLERMFAPFTKPDAGAQGTGIGLFICRRIVERHSGAIWAESGAGQVHVRFTLGGHGPSH